MESRIHDMAQLFVANGFGFGKYWNGYIFGKTAKDEHFLYLAENKMAILSAGIDEDGEKTILIAGDELSREQLNSHFQMDYNKETKIEWFEKEVHVLLLCKKKEEVRDNIIYFMWPAVKLKFVTEITENTLIIYDRFISKEILESLKTEAKEKDLSHTVEFWSMVKCLSLTDKFGEFAPKVCMSEALSFTATYKR